MKTLPTSSAHTPGPWEILKQRPIGGLYINADQKRICAIPTGHVSDVDPVSMANARLIATAPELLRELTIAYAFLDRISEEEIEAAEAALGQCLSLGDMKAAIAKAH